MTMIRPAGCMRRRIRDTIMPDEEILRDYRMAKNKFSQVGVLADRNCVQKREMAEWLRDHGQEVDKRYFAKKKEAGTERLPLTAEDAYNLAAVLDITLSRISFESTLELVSFAHAFEKLCVYGGYDLDHKEGEADDKLPIAKLSEDPVHD
jgi:hypothetical protein